ncbi:MAG: T9SS C-terminal target domain-containing protein [Chitinophagaceae bacterium]|nr:MAG: T9SS C-terminal target domain-containing protein [Chitinophagaceae bacterium]
MKFLTTLSILIISVIFLHAQTSLDKSLEHNQINRTYSIYIPATYDGIEAVPLVFNLHGYTSNSAQQELYTNFKPIADTANFILVHPNGTSESGAQFWNVGFFPSNVDDVGFLETLIDTISENYNIDLDRVFSTGMSNGGFMSYLLACESDRFTAVASVTGSMTQLNYDNCNTVKPIPAMQIHGTNDPTVPYEGTQQFLHVDSVVSFWVNHNNCDDEPVIIDIDNISPNDGTNTIHYTYSGGDEGSSVELYKVINGGHTWPGAPFSIGPTSQDFNASKVIWEFFSKYPKTVSSTNTISNQSKDLQINVFPNPAREILNIEKKNDSQAYAQIFNAKGQKVTETFFEYSTQLDISKLPEGIYMLLIQSDEIVISKKILVQ